MKLQDFYIALEAQLSGLVVQKQGASYTVPVIPGIPSTDYVRRDYPKIAFFMFGLSEDFDRRDQDSTLFDITAVAPFSAKAKPHPKPYKFMVQVEAWAQAEVHVLQLSEHIASRLARDSTYLTLKPTTLSADTDIGATTIPVSSSARYAINDWVIIDGRSISADQTLRQAFIVTGIPDATSLEVDTPLTHDFLQNSAVYEGRFDIVPLGDGSIDHGDDAGRPHVRWISTYEVWACLDLEAVQDVQVLDQTVPASGTGVTGVQLQIVLDYSRVKTAGSFGKGWPHV